MGTSKTSRADSTYNRVETVQDLLRRPATGSARDITAMLGILASLNKGVDDRLDHLTLASDPLWGLPNSVFNESLHWVLSYVSRRFDLRLSQRDWVDAVKATAETDASLPESLKKVIALLLPLVARAELNDEAFDNAYQARTEMNKEKRDAPIPMEWLAQ